MNSCGDDLVQSVQSQIEYLYDHILVGMSICDGHRLLCREPHLTEFPYDLTEKLFAEIMRHEIVKFVVDEHLEADEIPTLGSVCTADTSPEDKTAFRSLCNNIARYPCPIAKQLYLYMSTNWFGHPVACQGCQYDRLRSETSESIPLNIDD